MTRAADRTARPGYPPRAYEYATPGASWDELAYEEKNRWRNIAFAARVAAGDVKPPDVRGRPGKSDPSRR